MLFRILQILFICCVLLNATEEKPKPNQVNACWKDGESRGKGVLPEKESKECPKDHPEKSAGVCYDKCPSKMKGLGPVCWDDCTQMKYTSNGVVFCCDNDDTCSSLITDIGYKLPEALVKFAIDISLNPTNVLKLLKDFRELVADAMKLDLPMCKNVKDGEEFVDVSKVDEETTEENSAQQEVVVATS